MTAVGARTIEEIVERARAMLPRLRERAAATEALRRVPDETIEDFTQAGLFRVFQPQRYGGYELDYGRTQIELGSVLGQACGSSAWVQSVIACHAWCVGMFPAAAQDAVWAPDPDARVASAFSSSTGRGRHVDGGVFLEGDWQFSSGSAACQWVILLATLPGTDGDLARIWCLVPRSDWEIVDTWYAAGLRGTGSFDIRVKGAFVPTAFTVDTGKLDGRPTPGSAVNPFYIYRLPLYPVFPFNVASPALGIARGAIEAYIDQMAARPERASMPQIQLRIAESSAEVDAATALLRADVTEMERAGRAGQPLPPDLLDRVRRDLSYSVVICTRAVERLATALGAHGMPDANPVQRALRDVHAIGNHGGNQWDVQGPPFARALLGLPPAAPTLAATSLPVAQS